MSMLPPTSPNKNPLDKNNISKIFNFFMSTIVAGLVVNWISGPSGNFLAKVYGWTQNWFLGFINSSILNKAYGQIATDSLFSLSDITSIVGTFFIFSVYIIFFLFFVDLLFSTKILSKWIKLVLSALLIAIIFSSISLIQHKQNVILFFRQSISIMHPYFERRETLMLQSEFSRIETPDDYAKILAKIFTMEYFANECLPEEESIHLPSVVLPAGKKSSDLVPLFQELDSERYFPKLSANFICRSDDGSEIIPKSTEP